MKLHKLKLKQPYFDDVFYGRKDFEVRKNDRNFKIGDKVKLIEFPFESRQKYIIKRIKYILKGGQHGIDKSYVVLGLQDITSEDILREALERYNSILRKISFQNEN